MKWWFVAVGVAGILGLVGLGAMLLWPEAPRTTTVVAEIRQQFQRASALINPPSNDPAPITITAVGDIMLDRYVREVITKHGSRFPFENIQSDLNGNVVVGNLEGPFTNQASVATNEHLVFTFDPALAPTLQGVGFTTFSLANNHTLNFGQAGLENTRTVLNTAQLQAFGDPRNAHGFGAVHEINGRRVAFIGYHGLVTGRETILNDVREAESSGLFVVVMPHWGNEYQLTPSSRQVADAHALIDAGADLILGAHPHVVQPFEIYQGKFIAYSLGNFLFDQYFSADTLEGLLLRLTFDDTVVGIELVPLLTVNGQVTRLDGTKRDTLLERLSSASTVSDELRGQIQKGRLTISYAQP